MPSFAAIAVTWRGRPRRSASRLRAYSLGQPQQHLAVGSGAHQQTRSSHSAAGGDALLAGERNSFALSKGVGALLKSYNSVG
jgi:hypothetical protein